MCLAGEGEAVQKAEQEVDAFPNNELVTALSDPCEQQPPKVAN